MYTQTCTETHNTCKGRSKLMSLSHSINFNKTKNVSHCHGQGRRYRSLERKGAGVSTHRPTASDLKSGLWANHQPLLAPSAKLTSLPPLRDLPRTSPTSSSPSPLQPSIPLIWQPLTHTHLYLTSHSLTSFEERIQIKMFCVLLKLMLWLKLLNLPLHRNHTAIKLNDIICVISHLTLSRSFVRALQARSCGGGRGGGGGEEEEGTAFAKLWDT